MIQSILPQERLNKIVNVVNSAVVINTIEDKINFNIENIQTEYFYEDPIILYYFFTSGSTGWAKGFSNNKKCI